MLRFSPVVVAPTYDNARTLPDILAAVDRLALPIIVVNDGSGDDTAKILESWKQAHPHTIIHTHEQNRGKAAALQTGFQAAREAGYTHAVTIDTDGQLDAAQIPQLIAAAEQQPDALVLGHRDDTAADYPFRSRLGRRLSNLFVRMESGARVSDSQCGFRVYPLELVETVRCRAGRYAFETEILTRAAWAGYGVVQVPVTCVYPPREQRVSHFRPWVDSVRGFALHARLVGRAIFPWPHKKRRNNAAVKASEPLHKQALAWINPREAIRQLRRDHVGRSELAAGLALGAFIANLPLFGVQTLVALYGARRLHLHPIAVVLGSQLSIPPIAPFLIAAAIGTGHFLFHGSLPNISEFDVRHVPIAQLFRNAILYWITGGIIVGLACAVIVFAMTLLLFRVLPFTQRENARREQ